MGLTVEDLPVGALVLVDTAPIIYTLEGHPELAPRFRSLFERHSDGTIQLAVTTITIAEVMTGPLTVGDEALAKRYRGILESWTVVPLSAEIAESAARLRSPLRLRLPDAIQAASALAIGADALATNDRDFAKLKAVPVLF